MNVNGITSVQAQNAYQSYAVDSKKETAKAESKVAEDTGVIYERSEQTAATKKYKPDVNLINKLKANLENRLIACKGNFPQLSVTAPSL